MGLEHLNQRLKRLLKEHRESAGVAARPVAELFDDPVAPPPDEPRDPAITRRLDPLAEYRPDLQAYFDRLSTAQLRAATAEDPCVLLRAHAGSGKTTTLLARLLVAHVIEGVPFERMLVMTFTRRAAEELRTRFEALLGRTLEEPERRRIGTIHGVCRALLEHDLDLGDSGRRPGFRILDASSREEWMRATIARERLIVKYARRLDRRLDAARRGEFRTGAMKQDDDIGRLLQLFEDWKRAENVVDFDDMIALTRRSPSLGTWPDTFVLLDELQDCDVEQLDLLDGLRGRGGRLFMVGDPHQEIYAFRTQSHGVFAAAAARFECRELALPVNYRSTATIVAAARALLGRSGRDLVGTKERGEKIVVRRHQNVAGEAAFIRARLLARAADQEGGAGETAVLVRLREHAALFREEFERLGVAVRLHDEAGGSRTSGPAVVVATLHASKGLEFDHVHLAMMNAGLVPLSRGRLDAEREAEERRLFFVGMTRARTTLELSWHQAVEANGMRAEPTPFLDEIPGTLLERFDRRSESRSLAAGTPPPQAVPEVARDRTSPGARVRHGSYGPGTIVEAANGRIKVAFSAGVEREFIVAFAKDLHFEEGENR